MMAPLDDQSKEGVVVMKVTQNLGYNNSTLFELYERSWCARMTD
ncbi:hypothetical protein TIFTF001_004473 [Ficus carica]|uniref:Uncharacterized protein n=1 Tax=Ficus carica TaxID=3494 RepID=A0AA87ZJD3_FICCA|nr:hypothetical protein TIFTF001_004473 [Ficus carica]